MISQLGGTQIPATDAQVEAALGKCRPQPRRPAGNLVPPQETPDRRHSRNRLDRGGEADAGGHNRDGGELPPLGPVERDQTPPALPQVFRGEDRERYPGWQRPRGGGRPDAPEATE